MSRSLRAALCAASLAFPSALAAQAGADAPRVPADDVQVRRALAIAAAAEPRTLASQVELCEIPAPPFKEQARAEEYRRRFQALGLRDVRIDAEGNVLGVRPGEPGGPVVVLSGHLDTVFPEGTDVTVHRDGDVLRGPGIGDDCRGLAVVLAVAETLREAAVVTRGTLVFVGTVGEEGAGNLRGVRHLFETELKDRVDYFISVDGTGLGYTKDAVGSYRYRVAFSGPGGHSYGAFGLPNPIHALGRAIAALADLTVPPHPKTTFSVGIVEGGTSVNAIPAAATMQVDLRSEDPAALDELDARFREAVQRAVRAENARWSRPEQVRLEVERWGLRPAGRQSADAPIVRAAVQAGEALGFSPAAGASSTDANLPIALGIPAITMDGGGLGGGAHSLDEWFEPTNSARGTQWVLLTVLALAGLP